jgi:hypothetical protein
LLSNLKIRMVAWASPLGLPVGVEVGVPLGLPVGVPDGVPDGLLLGVAEAEPVGVALGEALGLLLGEPDGLLLGEPDGLPLGDSQSPEWTRSRSSHSFWDPSAMRVPAASAGDAARTLPAVDGATIAAKTMVATTNQERRRASRERPRT